jgi:acetyl esterase/lipase
MRIVLILVVFIMSIVQITAQQKVSVKIFRDLDYIANVNYENNKDKLDLYLPEGRSRFPVIISVHGGALIEGDKQGHGHIGQHFASQGFGTVVVNYRLSPGVTHPAHVQDLAAAISWVKLNIAKYGGDPNAIFVIGHSAGAYLTALVALDKKYLSAHKLSPGDLRGIVPVSGFFYVDKVASDRPKHVWGTEMTTWLEASPSRYLHKDAPPLLLIYADGDDSWRRQQNEDLALQLRKAGHRDIAVKQIAGRNHLTIWSKIGDGEEVSNLIIDFISRLTNAKVKQRL